MTMNKIKILFLIIFLSFIGQAQVDSTQHGGRLGTVDFEENYEAYKLPLIDFVKTIDSIPVGFDHPKSAYSDPTYLITIHIPKKLKQNQRLFENRDSSFLEHYRNIAFLNRGKDNKRYMKYWKEPVKLFFGETVPYKVKRQVKLFAKELNGIADSLQVETTRRKEKANIIIYFSDGFDFEPRISANEGIDWYLYWKGAHLNRGSIELDPKVIVNEKIQINSIKKSLVRMLGYFGTSPTYGGSSAFSSLKFYRGELNEFDIEIIKYHYDYGICKGTSLEVFDNLHRKAKIFEKYGIPLIVTHAVN